MGREGKDKGEKEGRKEARKAGVKKSVNQRESHREDNISRTAEASSHTSCFRKNESLNVTHTCMLSFFNTLKYHWRHNSTFHK